MRFTQPVCLGSRQVCYNCMQLVNKFHMRNPIQLLKGSFGIFSENPRLFLGVLLVPILFSILSALFEPSRETGVIDTLEWSIFILITLAVVVVNIFMGIALTLAVDNRSLTVAGAYRASRPFFWRYIGLSLLMTLILTIAFILLIIPGVILSVWFVFATFVLILENGGVIESLKRSREYVRGKWWGVFGRLVAVTLLAFLAMAVLFGVAAMLPGGQIVESVVGTVVGLILAPIMIGYMYLLYQDAKGQGATTAVSASPAPAGEAA